MNVGILFLGVVGGALVGAGIEAQARSARRRTARLARDGVAALGTITSVEATGRHLAWRRITVTVDGASFLETVPFVEAGDAGLVEGAVVPVLVMADDPSVGCIDRVIETSRLPVGVIVGLFIAGLGVAAAVAL